MEELRYSDLLAKLQLIQDLLSEELGLCLFLVNKQGEEVTLPSALPLMCFESEKHDDICRRSHIAFLQQALESEEPVFNICSKGLHVVTYLTKIMTDNNPIFLIGGFTRDNHILKNKINLLTAIYSLLLIATNISKHRQSLNLISNSATDILSYGLTTRELNILSYIAAGLSNKDIAFKLYLSQSTVKTHVANIFKKLGLRNRTEASIFAAEKGIKSRDNDV
jgi:DNA-binding CsgD family transcriptional regulator